MYWIPSSLRATRRSRTQCGSPHDVLATERRFGSSSSSEASRQDGAIHTPAAVGSALAGRRRPPDVRAELDDNTFVGTLSEKSRSAKAVSSGQR